MKGSVNRVAQILRPLACILASMIVVMKVMKSPETKAYRDVKHNFVLAVGRKVKGWEKVVDVKTCRLRFSRTRLTLTPLRQIFWA
jgi:hypothetical protein